MDAETCSDSKLKDSSAPKRWGWIVVSVLFVCAVTAIGIEVFYMLTIENSEMDNQNKYESSDSTPETEQWVSNEEIQILRKYLTFPTITHSKDTFGPCASFLEKLAKDLDLDVSVLHLVDEQHPLVVMTWKGSQPELPSILLNSHVDVVPVLEEYWTYPPFGAKIDKNGKIYARGAQDMKSIGMQYLGAIRALKRKNIKQLKRTIHLSYVPDEEDTGEFGMDPFVKSDFFKNMNVGFGLDEGYPSVNENLDVYFAEKPDWEVTITASGHSGHASILFDDTAGEKLNYVVNKFMEFRKNETIKWKEQNYPYGNVTSINLTILNGGLKGNVVPPEMSAFFDLRLSINTDWDELEQTIKQWGKEAGSDVKVEISKGINAPATPIDDSNPYWLAFKKATDELKLNVTSAVFRAVTDSRFVRKAGIPALGFSPLMNTPPMLHEHNEYVNADVYLKGIEIYEKIIETIGNIA